MKHKFIILGLVIVTAFAAVTTGSILLAPTVINRELTSEETFMIENPSYTFGQIQGFGLIILGIAYGIYRLANHTKDRKSRELESLK